jgi:predicted DNA repair protein MutK
MKALSTLGTAAMFMVGGGILVHGVPAVGHGIDDFAASLGWAAPLVASLAGALVGLIAGGVVLGLLLGVQRLYRRGKPDAV